MLRFDYHNERQNPVGGKQVMPGAIEAPHPARILATPPGLVRAELVRARRDFVARRPSVAAHNARRFIETAWSLFTARHGSA